MNYLLKYVLIALIYFFSAVALFGQSKYHSLSIGAGPAFTGSGDIWGIHSGFNYEMQVSKRWAWNTGYRINLFRTYFLFNNQSIPFYTDYCHNIGANLVFYPLHKESFRIALTGGIVGHWWHRTYAREEEIHHPDFVALGYEIGPRFDWICKHSWIISLSALAQNDLEENPIGSIQFSLGKRW